MPAQLVLVTNAWIPETVLQRCREVCATCADLLDEPVHFWRVSDGTAFGLALGALRDAPTNVLETIPPRRSAPMSSAPFIWRADGRPDWRAMWSDFCDLALLGGPPHRGPEHVVRGGDAAEGAEGNLSPIDEVRRGIWETTGLECEPAGPGWLAVECDSRRMAAWMCAAIVLENVEASFEGTRLRVPASPAFTIEDEVKSVVTVVAKVHHYWTDHFRSAAPRG
jgi:sirohydrochlorin cobaltochelatase